MRIAMAFEAGRDGFWLARWLRLRGVEADVIHSTSVAVPREHRRAKTDRLDTELLKRVFIGWLRGEPDHCRMAAILLRRKMPSARTVSARIWSVSACVVNRTKSCLARLGTQNFKSTLGKAWERLETLRTPEGGLVPPNTLAELRRDLARLRLIMDQVKEIRQRIQQIEQYAERSPCDGTACWPAASASALRRRTCWYMRCCPATCAIDELSRVMMVSRSHWTKAGAGNGKKVLPRQATRGCVAA